MGGGECSRAHARSRIDRLRGVRCGTRHRIVVHFHPRAPSLGHRRVRSLSSARTDARIGTSVSHDGRAVGLCVLPGGVLSALRRSSGDSAHRAGAAQRAGAAARLQAGDALGRSAHSDLRRIAHRIAVVQHGLRVDAVVRRGVHGHLSRSRSRVRPRDGRRCIAHLRAVGPVARAGAAIPSKH